MITKIVNNYDEWQKYFEMAGSPSFLQAWEWGNVQERLGYRADRMAIFNTHDMDRPLLIAQYISIKAKRGRMIFAPHGPIFLTRNKDEIDESFQIFIKNLHKLAKGNFSFLRIALGSPTSEENLILLKKNRLIKAPIYMHAERMWVLDIGGKSEDELLSGMRKTTRYSIKKAARDGVSIKIRTDDDCIADFQRIYKQTAEREKFSPFSEKFITAEFEEFRKTGNAVFLFAEHENQILAGALILFTKSGAFYHQGASTHSKIPAPYLLQWEAIRLAKSRGCRIYNFWGILQDGRTPKNWGGLSLFKKGFGGYQVDYTPTHDKPLTLNYYITAVYEKFLSWKRGV